MAPANPPWQWNPKAKEEWRSRLQTYATPIARQCFNKWVDQGNTQWPNLYIFDRMLETRTKAGQRNTDSCDLCDTTGWVEGPPFEQNGHTYSSSQPCTCSHGQERAQSRIWTER